MVGKDFAMQISQLGYPNVPQFSSKHQKPVQLGLLLAKFQRLCGGCQTLSKF
jgi:hypothetical protein